MPMILKAFVRFDRFICALNPSFLKNYAFSLDLVAAAFLGGWKRKIKTRGAFMLLNETKLSDGWNQRSNKVWYSHLKIRLTDG